MLCRAKTALLPCPPGPWEGAELGLLLEEVPPQLSLLQDTFNSSSASTSTTGKMCWGPSKPVRVTQ